MNHRRTAVWFLAPLFLVLCHPGVMNGDPMSLDEPAASMSADATGPVRLGDLRVPREQWTDIHLKGKKIGYGRLTFSERLGREDGGYQLAVHYRMPYFHMDQMQQAVLAPDLSLREICLSLSAGDAIRFEGAVEGGELRGVIEAGGQAIRRNYPANEPVYLSETLPLLHLIRDLPARKPTTWSIFRPDSFTIHPATMELLETHPDAQPPTAVFRVEVAGSITESTWTTSGAFVAEKGLLSGLEYASRAVPREEALAMPTEAEERLTQSELVQDSRIGTGATIERPQDATSMTVRIGPLSPDGPWVDGRRQQLVETDGSMLTLRIRTLKIPAPEKRALPEADQGDLAEWTRPSLLIQSDHPDLVARAREIVGDATDPWDKAMAIHDYCYRKMDRTELRSSLPSALEVLHSLKGDCNEHAALYTGLARAVGLPAKPIGGLLYLYDGEKSGFYYHAWNEVALETPEGVLWVPIDSTLGEKQADATHIKLVEGDLDQQAAINDLIGKLQVVVVEVEY